MPNKSDRPLDQYIVYGWVKRELLTPDEVRELNVSARATGTWVPLGQYAAWSPRHAIKRAQAQPWERVSRFRASREAARSLPLFE